MEHTSNESLPRSGSVIGNPVTPPGTGLIACVERIMEDLAPLLAKAGLPSDFDALAAIKLAKKSPVAPVACPRPVVGSPPARYRLVTSVTSDNSPVDAAHEAGMAAGLLKCFLQGNTDLDKDPVVRMAFTAGVRLAELKAILNSQPPIKAKPRSPFFAVAQKPGATVLPGRRPVAARPKTRSS